MSKAEYQQVQPTKHVHVDPIAERPALAKAWGHLRKSKYIYAYMFDPPG